MISEQMQQQAKDKGIKSIRFDPGLGPLVAVHDYQCSRLWLDHTTGGVWYQLNSANMAIPMEQGMVYVYPAAMRAIQFNE